MWALTAVENLVHYSQAQPAIFKLGQLTPVKDLKLLIRDYAVCQDSSFFWFDAKTASAFKQVWFYIERILLSDSARWMQPIAKNALTILINISSDADVLKSLAEDNVFLEWVLLRITVRFSPKKYQLYPIPPKVFLGKSQKKKKPLTNF